LRPSYRKRPVAQPQLVHQPPVQARLGGEVEVREALEDREPGELQVQPHRLAAALLDLAVLRRRSSISPACGGAPRSRRLAAALLDLAGLRRRSSISPASR
jgi:hypothetical protein